MSRDEAPGSEVSLGATGTQLWNDIHKAREVPAHMKVLVLNACRIADRLDKISDDLASDGRLTITLLSKNGDEINEVANPLLIEMRMQAAAFSQLMARMGVDKLPQTSVGKPSIADELRKAREAREAKHA